MRYTVVWRLSTEADLAVLWVRAKDRNAVRMAADRIDRMLLANPLGVGRRHVGGTRILVVDQVGVTYKVNEEDRVVTVLSVWRPTKSTNGRPH